MELTVQTLSIPLKEPFAIAYSVVHAAELVRVTLKHEGVVGRGEAAGVDYFNETAETMTAQIEGARKDLEAGCSLEDLQTLMRPGGARNAVDCAYWDLLTKKQNRSIWDLTGIVPETLSSVYTISLETPAKMQAKAKTSLGFSKIKIKLDANAPIERVKAVRDVRPDAQIIVDVNQGWTLDELKDYAPTLRDLGVKMIEQPLPTGGDDGLLDYRSPVPLGADESCQTRADLDHVRQRYQVVNIKLDKTGGLTEALKLRAALNASGMSMMVGCMTASSLSMAPGCVVAQGCDFVDLDGPLFLTEERLDHPLSYGPGGEIELPSRALWG